jgi:hypothetical protein
MIDVAYQFSGKVDVGCPTGRGSFLIGLSPVCLLLSTQQ